MFQCPRCQSELVVGQVSHQQQVRCARCGTVSWPQTENVSQRKPNRAARWSLWLGLSSILLFSITGIPALILGIRSLLQMRYERPTKWEKEAGVVGTILGTVFGVLLGGCILTGGGMILFAILSIPRQQTNDPAVIRQWMDQVVRVDLPKELEPRSARFLMGTQTRLEFDNATAADKGREMNLTIIHLGKSPDFNLQTIKDELNRAIGDKLVLKQLKQGSTEQLEWTICGKPTEVFHTSYIRYVANTPAEASLASGSGVKAHRYIALVSDDQAAVGLRLFSTETNEGMRTAEVRRIFESLEMVQD